MAEPATAGAAFLNVFRRELGFAWRNLLAWSIPGMAMIGLTVSMQPEMSKTSTLARIGPPLLAKTRPGVNAAIVAAVAGGHGPQAAVPDMPKMV